MAAGARSRSCQQHLTPTQAVVPKHRNSKEGGLRGAHTFQEHLSCHWMGGCREPQAACHHIS